MDARGPDDSGEWWSQDGRVGLAHRRLAIVDLSKAGHQPMQDASRELTLIFNGEIYNYRELREELVEQGHRFFSSTDTEVILAAYREWGDGFVNRLNGMFAFALHDLQRNSVLLARDRDGQKPLFYCYRNGELRFASELKALLTDRSFPRQVDSEGLDLYLTLGYVPGGRCILKGVRKLPAAHSMLFECDTGNFSIQRYWRMPAFDGTASPASEAQLIEELENLLQKSVQRQMSADVPVGILLSGGVDSSLVTAMAARSSTPVRTFTVGNPGHGRYDESQHARLIASHFGTVHTELSLGDVNPSILFTLARTYDEPIIDSSMVPTFLISELIRKHTTVALGGDGADELFGGYRSHDRIALLQEKFKHIPRPLRQAVALAAFHILPDGTKGKQFLSSIGFDIKSELPSYSLHFDVRSRAALTSNISQYRFVAENLRKLRVPDCEDAVQRLTRFDFSNYMAEDILVKVDRASMANSLEVRSPFLDNHLIDFAFKNVPSYIKATPRARKILLKRLAAAVLPSTFDLQRKQGFAIPLQNWLIVGPWRKLFEQVLFAPSSPFPHKYIRRLFSGLDSGKPYTERLFGLALFEVWRSEYNITI